MRPTTRLTRRESRPDRDKSPQGWPDDSGPARRFRRSAGKRTRPVGGSWSGASVSSRSRSGGTAQALALAVLPIEQEVTGKAEISPEPGQGLDQLRRSAVRMQEKADRRSRAGLQQFEHSSPSLQTMDACGTVEFGGECQLREERFLLSGVRQVRLPTVESDLPDARPGRGVKVPSQLGQPVRRSFVEIPWVTTKWGTIRSGCLCA